MQLLVSGALEVGVLGGQQRWVIPLAKYVTVPEKRDLNEANFILRHKPFKNVCYIETNVNFKIHWTITLDWTGYTHTLKFIL